MASEFISTTGDDFGGSIRPRLRCVFVPVVGVVSRRLAWVKFLTKRAANANVSPPFEGDTVKSAVCGWP